MKRRRSTGPVEPLIRNDRYHGWNVLCRRYGCLGFWRCELASEAECNREWVEHLKVCVGEARYA